MSEGPRPPDPLDLLERIPTVAPFLGPCLSVRQVVMRSLGATTGAKNILGVDRVLAWRLSFLSCEVLNRTPISSDLVRAPGPYS